MLEGVTDRLTGHWDGVVGVALLFVGVGVVVRGPGLVLAGVVGVGFAGYARTAAPPRVETTDGDPVLAIERALDDTSPDPGEEVTVRVALRNRSDALFSDVRVVDGVPEPLEVTDGSPRHGAALSPGDESVFSYTVTATRGEHDWRPAAVTVADPSGAIERETALTTGTTMRCSLPVMESDDLPLRALTTQYPGRLATDRGGEGVEFYATREHRSGDPLSRIDWRRRAKTGELGTLQFREERAAEVMLVVDTRRAAYRAPEPGGYHAVERSVVAASQAFSALLDYGNRAGITAFGPTSDPPWLSPGAGEEHRAHGREMLNAHPALSPVPPSDELYGTLRDDRREELKRRRITTLHRRLASDTQVFLFAACCDDYAPEIARRLDAYGHAVTVVSPDPTTDRTPRHELARLEREERLDSLRCAGLRVVDWRDREPFAEALARAETRWSV